MRYTEALRKIAESYEINNIPLSRKQELDKDDILPSNVKGDLATAVLTASPVAGIARVKARDIRRRTGQHSPYLHDYFGSLVSNTLFGGLVGAGTYAYQRARGVAPRYAAMSGSYAGRLAWWAPSIAAAAAALITRSRTIEEQAAADKEPLWKRYLLPGYGLYSNFKRIGSEDKTETASRRTQENATDNHTKDRNGVPV